MIRLILLESPSSLTDFGCELLWFAAEILLSAFLIDYLIKLRKSRRLKPIRQEFVQAIVNSIDNERLMVEFSFLTNHINLIISSIGLKEYEINLEALNNKLLRTQKILEVLANNSNEIVEPLKQKPRVKLSDSDQNILSEIIYLLNQIEKRLSKSISQIDSSQAIFTIEMNAIVSKVRQQLVSDIENISSLRDFTSSPDNNFFRSRKIGCLLSVDYYSKEVSKIWESIGKRKYQLDWINKKTDLTDSNQTLLIEKYYQSLLK